MTFIAEIAVMCDSCNTIDDANTDTTRSGAWEGSQSWGWHRTANGRHICPDCWEAGER